MLKVRRIYERPTKADGERILVDRLWPRGISKESAKIDVWMKDVAPSDPLRKWFAHDPARWREFKKRYFRELEENQQVLDVVKKAGERKTLTLLYGARDREHNNAMALMEFLRQRVRW